MYGPGGVFLCTRSIYQALSDKNIFFVIPARKNSKGFPFKNRKLLDFTINQIPLEFQQKTIITTDDEQIINRISSLKIKILKLDKKLCLDDTNIRDVMLDVSQKFEMNTFSSSMNS